MKTDLIAFTGPIGCGKTTAANMTGRERLSFAGPVRSTVKHLLDFTDWQLNTQEGKATVDIRYGVTPRLVMQRFATDFVRTTIPDLWVILMNERLNSYTKDCPIVIDDLRFENEAELVRLLGGTVIHITGRNEPKPNRWWQRKNIHVSELGVMREANDYVIDNSLLLSDLETQIKYSPFFCAD